MVEFLQCPEDQLQHLNIILGQHSQFSSKKEGRFLCIKISTFVEIICMSLKKFMQIYFIDSYRFEKMKWQALINSMLFLKKEKGQN